MSFTISQEAKKRLDEIKKQYPDPKSAVMSALYLVQEEHHHISDEAISWIADELGMSPVRVMELVTFYTMYRRKEVGKYHVQVCRTLSCGLCGARKLMDYLHERLGIVPGEVTEDGLFSYEHVECLGSCGTGPMCEINDTYFENLTPEKLADIIDRIQAEKPELHFSTLRDKLGEGLSGCPKSEVM
ncbi:MAG: NAD(P)H-dependent oxidoreductase subunit E [Bdellovibrionales bacterium]|nr:NAD(P)H-dependent oxidoreductase subunit E [Bdellovibrionales bacterium]